MRRARERETWRWRARVRVVMTTTMVVLCSPLGARAFGVFDGRRAGPRDGAEASGVVALKGTSCVFAFGRRVSCVVRGMGDDDDDDDDRG